MRITIPGGRRLLNTLRLLLAAGLVFCSLPPDTASAQTTGPTMTDPSLGVRSVIASVQDPNLPLVQPTTMAFLGQSDLLVLEKPTGRVRRVVNGVLLSTPVLDLAVNSGSERGLLGIALHPNFPATPYVYLYWTWRGRGTGPGGLLGADTTNLAELPSLWGNPAAIRNNRIDRFVWNGATLSFDRNLIRLRSYQADPGQPQRGNHNGGPLRFGPDGKLYLIMGDNGRRGFLQNILQGFGQQGRDDQFGGPEPDDAHLTGMILRLNDDGSAPADNPFFAFGATVGGQAGANLQKVFAYGVRNSFGLTFDPISGSLWQTENGDDSFGEINRVEPGSNSGWTQIMGPVSRIAEFKAIETSPQFFGLQQIRWPATLIANTPDEALSRLFVLPGSRYMDPQFSWRYELSPTALGFASAALGPQFAGDLFVGFAVPILNNGPLFRFKVSEDRHSLRFDDARLQDRVADNTAKYQITESETLQIGTNFGALTDIQTGPNGNLFVVSASRGAIYEIFRR